MRQKKKKLVVLPEQVWQTKREMSAYQYRQMLRQLRLTKAAASRVLGISQRTSYRYAKGQAVIPIAEGLLLRAFVEYGVKPLVPHWTREDN